MSASRLMIDITPPVYQQKIETLYVHNFECPVCHGRGSVISSVHEDRPETCGYCDGTGKVKARVTVEWEPQND